MDKTITNIKKIYIKIQYLGLHLILIPGFIMPFFINFVKLMMLRCFNILVWDNVSVVTLTLSMNMTCSQFHFGCGARNENALQCRCCC